MVPFHQLLQLLGEPGPLPHAVEAGAHRAHQGGVGGIAGPQLEHQRVELRARGRRARRPRRHTDRRRAAAQVEEGVQRRARADVRALAQERREERLRVAELALFAADPRGRVHVRAENHGPNPPRKQVGVGGAEERAVGVPVVRQLSVALGLTQEIHVARRLRGRHVPQQGAVPSLALPAEGGVALGPLRDLNRPDRERVSRQPDACEEAILSRLRGEALHRGAFPEPARIPGDDVEARAHRIGKEGVDRREQRLVRTRTARVEKERPDAARAIGGPMPDHREPDRGAVRVSVVQRCLRGRTIETLLRRAGIP